MAVRRSVVATLAVALLALVSLPEGISRAGGIGISELPEAPQGSQSTSPPIFHPYRVPVTVSNRAHRDLEFLWSDSYMQGGKPLNIKYNGSSVTELDKFGLTICEGLSRNAFGFDATDIALVYNYFNKRSTPDNSFRDSLYSTNANATTAFRVYEPSWPDPDRNNIDTYLYLPGDAGGIGANPPGQTPSYFMSDSEDVSTGHNTLADPQWRLNSVSSKGPILSGVGVTDPTYSWAAYDTTSNWIFEHEFQHSINFGVSADVAGYTPESALEEIWSNGAEAVAGERLEWASFDTPYTHGLMGFPNYQAYRCFAAYLAYNYRGADTSAAGMSDDLLWRWSGRRHGERTFGRLADRLSDAECVECRPATRPYFTGLTPYDRRELVVHQWRIAQYANNPSVAQGQYGYRPNFHFDPHEVVGTWQNRDGDPQIDSIAIPHEMTVTTALIERSLNFAGPLNLASGVRHVVGLESGYGADYWVVRSASNLWPAAHDLVVTVTPEGATPNCGGLNRLMVSAIQYASENLANGSPDSLWKHPEWVSGVIGPVAIDIVPGAPPVQLVVPHFGDQSEAVVVVATLGYPGGQDVGTGVYPRMILPYGLSLGIRSGTYLSPNPGTLAGTHVAEVEPVLCPTGDTLAYLLSDHVSPSRLYRKPVAGGTPAVLVQPVQGANQFHPDWSPRGDWVAFDQEATAGQCDIFTYNTWTGQLRHLTNATQHEFSPAFCPNGQTIAYLRVYLSGTYELHSIGVDGTGDVVRVLRSGAAGPVSMAGPRWGADGNAIYFVANDSLYSVTLATGAVVPRGYLLPRTTAFDLPLGAERVAVQHGWVEPKCAVVGADTPVSRIVLRELATGKDEMVFYRPASVAHDPKWSVDGTRLVFASTDSSSLFDSLNVRVGQVRYNHAPAWTNPLGQLVDQSIPAGVPWHQQMNATDADGEAMTFVGAYLPSGSSVVTVNPTSGIGEFDWNDPGPLGATYYIVFRALDPSGGVANKVVTYTILPSGGGGGCPFADLKTANGWITENSILGRSSDGSLALDAYRLNAIPAISGGQLSLRLRENQSELTTLDRVRLAVVDHPPGTELFADGEQQRVGSRQGAYRVLTSSGVDVTSQVNGSTAGLGFAGAPGDTLLVQMAPTTMAGSYSAQSTAGGGDGLLGGLDKNVQLRYDPTANTAFVSQRGAEAAGAIDQAWLNQSGIKVQAGDGAGGWTDVTRYYPREYAGEQVLAGLGSVPLRLIFVGAHHLRFIGRIVPSGSSPTVNLLSPTAATHTRFGNVRSAVAAAGTTTQLARGDTLTMSFTTPTQAANTVRDYVLMTDGVYTTITAPARLSPAAGSLPVRFALGQNMPNPFSGSTTIRFELPVSSRVRIEVFDLLGRRVRTLTNAEWPAGYHAVEWDGRDETGNRTHSGVFAYRMSAGGFREQKKMVITPR